MLSNRVYFRETTTEVSKISAHTDIDWGWSSKSPNGATLSQRTATPQSKCSPC